MKVLLIGSGSREHALAWHLKKDPRVTALYFAPGNAGTTTLGQNLPISATDLPALLAWAEKEKPDLTVVGPEAPLCLGVVDLFQAKGRAIFGPNKKAAQLEGSKIFTKQLLQKYRLPTGAGASFDKAQDAYAHSRNAPYPQVIKADGLASGKGVIIAQNAEEATEAIHRIMEQRAFGAAGARLLIEEFLTGQEISIMAFTDGQSLQFLPSAQDHKRLLDDDLGPNTGGMGACAPAPFFDATLQAEVTATIFQPLLEAFRQEGIDYRGVLYAGLMLTERGPQILEFNVRLGDPETQVILPLLETSLLDVAAALDRRELHHVPLRFHPQTAVGVVLAAAHYPETPRADDEITGLNEAGRLPGIAIFHGGTRLKDGAIVTAGGRVLTVTAVAENLSHAQTAAYAAVEKIQFSGAQYRRDIGAKSLRS